MIFIKKLLYFIGNIGKILSLVCLFIIVATLIVSFKLSKENVDNPFCLNNYDESQPINLEYQEILNYDYHYQCSTLYFEIIVIDNLNKNQTISLLISIGQQLKDYNCFTHFQVEGVGLEKVLYATIDLQTQELNYVF